MDEHPAIAESHLSGMSPAYIELAGGHRLFVRDWGSGEPLLLLAGWAMDSRIWGETMVALNHRGLRTIAYDRRGHGRSTDPGTIDYDSLADDLAAVVDQLDLQGVTLVCHSGAAGEAMRYVTRHGNNRLARIVLVGGTGPKMLADATQPVGLTAEMLDGLLAQLACDLPGWIDENAEPFAPACSPRVISWLGSMVLDCSRRIIIDFQRVIATADLREEAAALRVPVVIIHGDQDVSAPIDLTARAFERLIPDAELIVYEGAAHGIMVTHAPRLAADLAERVLHG
jgi:pimeloyl-ACP methyl ester carboxylesterase